METDITVIEESASMDVPSEGTAATMIPNPERLAVKAVCGADILKNSVHMAEKLKKIDKTLSRYLCQAQMLLTWKRGSGVMKMAGSAAKTVGTLMLVAAPLHPRFAMGMRVAHKLWKLGTGLKILNALANMIRDVWQKGCRDVLVEFTHCAASLTRNLGVFGEVVRDLQNVTPILHDTGHSNPSPAVVMNILREFIPAHQLPYATHVINMACGNERYSPLFAFTALTLNPGNNSNIAQVMLEIESFHFDEFLENNESAALVAIGSFLHVSRELCDFLDGLQHLTQRDCNFLQECLQKLAAESVNIMKVVALLTSLEKIRKQVNSDTSEPETCTPSLYDNRDVGQSSVSRSAKSTSTESQKVILKKDFEQKQEYPTHIIGLSTPDSINPTPFTADGSSLSQSQPTGLPEEMTSCFSHAVELSEFHPLQHTHSESSPDRGVEKALMSKFESSNLPTGHHNNTTVEDHIRFLPGEDIPSAPDRDVDKAPMSICDSSNLLSGHRSNTIVEDIELLPGEDILSEPDRGSTDVGHRGFEGKRVLGDVEQPSTSSRTQSQGLVGRFFMPISSTVGRGTTKLVGKSRNLFPFSFTYHKKLSNSDIQTGQPKSPEAQDQFREAQESSCDLTRV